MEPARELRPGTAREAGFDAERLERAFDLVESFVVSGRLPGAVVAVGRRGVLVGPRAYGWAQVVPESQRRPMKVDTLFDLASLTKPMVTAVAAMRLIEMGRLSLGDTVARWLPEVTEGAEGRRWASQVTVWHLLTHTGGLPGTLRLYRRYRGVEAVMRGLGETPLRHKPGTTVEYSCSGFILLGEMVARAAGQRLDLFARDTIFRPLGMHTACFNPPPQWAERCAATERYPGTDEVVVGKVHDRNAQAMGGVSGNAGLFGTAEDVGRFAWMMVCEGAVGGARVLSTECVRQMRKLQTAGLGQPRGLGWVVRDGDEESPAGRVMSASAFGHTGFTGTSLWIDPDSGAFYVLLTNAIHPTRDNAAHFELRPRFHDLAAGAVLAG